MDRVTHEYFQPLIERSFTVHVGEEALALRVTDVQKLPLPRRRTLTGKDVEIPAARAPFTVFFRSEGNRGLEQGTYDLEPPDGGEPMTIFIVPLGMEEGGVIYEAVFN